MSRSPAFARLTRTIRIADYCERHRLSTAEGLDIAAAHDAAVARGRATRREWLTSVGRLSAAAAVASVVGPARRSVLAFAPAGANVGIVGAGLTGLACADELAAAGIAATLYDASTRVGGRCFSLPGLFPGQVAERGGEFIDNFHKTLLKYAQRFGLAVEDVNKVPGDVFYFFDGQHVPESTVVDEFRDFVTAMRIDLRALSQEVTADSHTADDIRIDRANLLEYLEGANGAGRAAGAVIKAAIIQAYIAEYGLEPDEQSCLNFLLFIHGDRRSKFTPFGVFSDERWHVVSGNDRIATGLAADLPSPPDFDMRLVRVRKTAASAIELTFRRGASTFVRIHDFAVLAIPFSVLRSVELDANLGVPANQRSAINLLGYGTNAKMMVGFTARPWSALGSNGTAYSDLPNHQTTWETNPTAATAGRAVLTDYSGGTRGANLNPNAVQTEAARFLADLNRVYSGAAAAARRTAGGQIVAHLEHWPSNPLTRGSYTCYLPGQFTSIAGLEGKPVGNLLFAGEHANSFYDAQGFMEGAALSGIQAASDVLAAVTRK